MSSLSRGFEIDRTIGITTRGKELLQFSGVVDFNNELLSNQQNASILVLTGSHSDFERIVGTYDHIQGMKAIIEEGYYKDEYDLSFEKDKALAVSDIASAHRTPLYLLGTSILAASRGYKVIIGAAGGSAHLPGMAAAMTRLPVIAIPCMSSGRKGEDSQDSMLFMPPGVPNVMVPIKRPDLAGKYAVEISTNPYILAGNKGINFSNVEGKVDEELIKKLGLVHDSNSPIVIQTQDLDKSELDLSFEGRIPLVTGVSDNPVAMEFGNYDNLSRVNGDGLYVSAQVKGKEKFDNSILFGARIVGTGNEDVASRVYAHMEKQSSEVRGKSIGFLEAQLISH